jgi:hypothetical protein
MNPNPVYSHAYVTICYSRWYVQLPVSLKSLKDICVHIHGVSRIRRTLFFLILPYNVICGELWR